MILDSIIDSLLLLANACFKSTAISLIFFFLIWEMPKNMPKTIHETPKFLPCFFHKSLKLVNSIPEDHVYMWQNPFKLHFFISSFKNKQLV